MDSYEDFIAQKQFEAPSHGLSDVPELSPLLFLFQRVLVEMALRKGRFALFADTGLGKGWMTLEWCRCVAEAMDAPVLLLAPIAVSRQFEREAKKLGSEIRIVASHDDVGAGINVTNYHKLHRFKPEAFAGVALDESSILKSFDGTTRTTLIDAFKATPFRLCATATGAPNDHAELGNHAQFLGVCSYAEMLATFFVHDGESSANSGGWRLKGHARAPFWRWVASWAASIRRPSDLGFEDTGYVLPPLVHHQHIVAVDASFAREAGTLFADTAAGLAEQRSARRATLDVRVAKAAEIVNASTASTVVWCELNDEGDALECAIPGSVQVAGKDLEEAQEQKIADFIEGRARVLVGKASQLGFGLNLQHARTVVFVGATNSFEQYYQAIRRVWRFGQKHDVDVHVIVSEVDGRVVENLKRKEAAAAEMAEAMVVALRESSLAEMRATGRVSIDYAPAMPMRVPSWLRTEGAPCR